MQTMVELKLNLKIVLLDGFELIKEPNFWAQGYAA